MTDNTDNPVVTVSSETIKIIRESGECSIEELAQRFNLRPEDVETIRTKADALAITQTLGPPWLDSDDGVKGT